MIDSLTSDNRRDFRQRYQGTFGWFLKANKIPLFVYVKTVTDSAVYFTDLSGHEWHANVDSDLKFEFIPVNHGFFNGALDVYYLERVPARQWQRGISAANTRIWSGTRGWVGVEMKTLAEIFVNPLSLNEALDLYLKGDRACVALSKHFALLKNQLCFYLRKIGVRDDHRIALTSSLVRQEFMDTIRRNSLPFQVN